MSEGPQRALLSVLSYCPSNNNHSDVSRFDGRYEVVYETTTAGVTIQSPQLDINTVAAGGGSCLTFRNGLFLAGPHSAGAEPGPVCYRYLQFFGAFLISYSITGKAVRWL